MRKIILITCLIILSMLAFSQERINLSVDPFLIEKKVSDKIYGVLMEHLYHSISNGLWGETVWNRSFEERLAYGRWEINSQGLVEVDALNDENAIFKIATGDNYEMTFDIRRVQGGGKIKIGLRDQYREELATNSIYCNLGVNNTFHCLVANTGWVWHTPTVSKDTIDYKKGRLENNKWYSLKLKCNGNHIKVWVDNTILFDRIIENCPKNGAIRIGVEKCRAEFRNIKVYSLNDRKNLLSLNPIRHWQFIGNGTISAITDNVLNHNTAVRVQLSDKKTGIEQPDNFNIKKDDALTGSIFLRGNVKSVDVQLVYGDEILAKQSISGITEYWNEFKLSLNSIKDCSQASLQIISTQGKGDLYIDQVSLIHQSSITNGGYRKDIDKAIMNLNPAIIRWPGGSFVELYNFTNGIGKQKDRTGKLRWDDFDPMSFGTDEFIAYCRKIGAEPQIVLPIGYHNYDGYSPNKNGETDWLKKAQDWVEYCNGDTTTQWGAKRAANGHPEPYNVEYWEIDNEVWKMDAKFYANIVKLFSETLKKQYPSIKIIGCGSGRLGNEGIGLDSILIKMSAEYIDYISPHHYMELKKFGNEGVDEYERYLKKLNDWIAKSDNPDIKIYVSEWNLEQIDMRTGLFTGGILNLFEKIPNVEMAACALLLRHTSATGWNNAFINFDQSGWFAAPNYIVMKLWREHFAPCLIPHYGETKDLNIVSTKTEDNKTIYVKVVNPSNKEYNLVLDINNPFHVTSSNIKKVAPDTSTAANSLNNKDVVKVSEEKIMNIGNVVTASIPQNSTCVIVIN